MTPLPQHFPSRLDQAFVFSVFGLRFVTLRGRNTQSIRVGESVEPNLFQSDWLPKLELEISLPYDSQEFLKNGGDTIKSVLSLGETPYIPNSGGSYQDNDSVPVGDVPIEVHSLEKFCLWTAKRIQGYLASNKADLTTMTIQFFEELSPSIPSEEVPFQGTIKIKANLLYDGLVYLRENNYLSALRKLEVYPSARSISTV